MQDTTLGTTVGNLRMEWIAFPAPVFAGDTLRVETKVVALRPSKSRPAQGIVTFEHVAFNQANTVVCRRRRLALMMRGLAEVAPAQPAAQPAPVIARAMTICWICVVPSYRRKSRTSR